MTTKPARSTRTHQGNLYFIDESLPEGEQIVASCRPSEYDWSIDELTTLWVTEGRIVSTSWLHD